jgi:uncharacterized Zn finger protein (UPF0148 family)
MKCPNCQLPFTEEKDPKFLCSTCGWLEKVGKEWKSCESPESPPPQESEPDPVAHEPEPVAHEPDPAAHEPDPAAHEPDPAAQEPDPAALEPDPKPKVKKYLGGLLTITHEVDE